MPYERFEAWHRAHELALAVYAASQRWPTVERFGLTSQTRRAALSVPTNLAEGSGLRGSAQFRRHLDIAIGSLSELAYLLRFARDFGFLGKEEWAALDDLRNRAGQLTWRLKQSMNP